MNKPRYWQVAFPLAVTSLCVAPQAFFLKQWQAMSESALTKLKVLSRLPMFAISNPNSIRNVHIERLS